ncbi:hypothetical protein [Candidatus Laterigemmans baculatus]|uniref:hypothetical protein n=1 Tax=Candidatus Laterigemmans baculatus TaxID=2770505 RepID=UPI0013DCB3AB|nr:hypothetical protein [Candidatus Laterigemmans baculatus]
MLFQDANRIEPEARADGSKDAKIQARRLVVRHPVSYPMAQPQRSAKARRSAPARASASDLGSAANTTPSKTQRRLDLLGLVLALSVAAVAALQPICSEDLWWQLSRGRQVLLGSVQPSADLLTLETAREADWLGGVPGYLLYAALGAGGLMVARLAIVTFLAWRWIAAGRFEALLTGGLALLAISPALSPLPGGFDVIAIVLLMAWSSRARSLIAEQRSDRQELAAAQPLLRRHLAWLGLLFFAWGNLGGGIGLGAGLLLVTATTATLLRQSLTFRFGSLALLVAGVAGSLNPRGLGAWSDSVRLLFPAATVSPAVLEQTPWAPLPSAAWGFPSLALLILTLLWLARCVGAARLGSIPLGAVSGERRTRAVQFLFVQGLAWFSAANVPLAIAWLASDLVDRWRIASEHHDGKSSQGAGVALATAAALILAMFFSGRLDSLGWGIDARLDPRLLEIALAETRPAGTAFADDVRSGGMLAWTLPPVSDRPGLRLQDVPSRALIGGRLAEHQHLLVDLRTGRQTRYWRQDRSPGGFWLALQLRNTSLLCISSDRFELVRALEPTIWKPLSLDSPVIPYARAGDAAYADQLLAVLRYRQLVNLDPWTYVVPPSSGSEFDRDLFGLRETAVGESLLVRQARTFRAMELHYAALRVLFVGRQRWPQSGAIEAEIRHCQEELAHQERRVAGQASWLRDWAAQSSDIEQLEPRDPPRLGRPSALLAAATKPAEPPEVDADEQETEAKRTLLSQLRVYWADGPAAALQAAGEQAHRSAAPPPAAAVSPHPQLAYAWVCWAIESGQHEFAQELGRSLTARPLPPNLRILVQYRMEDAEQ